MGLVNFWAIPHLSLLSPLLCSSSWLLLFITGGVASEAASKEAGSKSHPYSTFLRRASQNKKDLGHFYLFHYSPGRACGLAGRAQGRCGTCPSLLPCAVLSPLRTLCISPRPLSRGPSSCPPELGASHLEYGLCDHPNTSPSVSKEMGGGASWLRNCFANGSIFV